MQPVRRLLLLSSALLTLLVLGTAPASAAGLKAGAGKADITPKTGYYLGGWTRADRVAQGQHTRLFARTLVLERDGRKVALVSIDLFMVPGGMVKQIGDRLAARGLTEQNILVSASHTHSGPGGYANFPTLNTRGAEPRRRPTDPNDASPTSSTRRPPTPSSTASSSSRSRPRSSAPTTTAAPAAAGWGSDRIVGLTQNRSIEAHLADHGIIKARGEGAAEDDPERRRAHDRPRRRRAARRQGRPAPRAQARRRVPIGALVELRRPRHGHQVVVPVLQRRPPRLGDARLRGRACAGRARCAPARRSSTSTATPTRATCPPGLDRNGPAASDYVGRVEAAAMLRAWKRAGRAADARRRTIDAALDAHVLLRPGHRGRPGRRPSRRSASRS